ncbi:MAG: J domain-containing protein [Desulfobacteraceae bacterium]|nr:J domain-containing protein [Desulfobacteraceae bacterium]
MDINQAFIILNLKHDACLEDAKDSFRTLAKRYHPDKLQIHNTEASANDKMKEINLAFQILKKTLEPRKISKPKIKKPIKTTKSSKNFSLQNLNIFLKKVQKNFFKTKTTFSKPSQFAAKKKNFRKANKTFDSVLNKTIKKSSGKSYSEPVLKNLDPSKSKSKNKFKNTYSKYIQLKQRMRSKRKHSRPEGFAPIEKISPISPIKKI